MYIGHPSKEIKEQRKQEKNLPAAQYKANGMTLVGRSLLDEEKDKEKTNQTFSSNREWDPICTRILTNINLGSKF